MFVDIHSHIIPGIDDGAKDIKTAVDMIRLACSSGTSHIIATPHFIPGSVLNTSDIVDITCCDLQQLISKEAISINLYPGCELFISPDLLKLYNSGRITTLNNSSYMLIELPMTSMPLYTEEVLYNLQTHGLIPIIAHPERNATIISNPGILKNFVKRGILAQVNSGSITGVYDREIQNAAMKFIKMGLIHFVASDAHTCGVRSPVMVKAAEIVKKKFGIAMAESLFYKNGMTVLENGIIDMDI